MGCACSRDDPEETYRCQQLDILTPDDRNEVLQMVSSFTSINTAIEWLADAYFHARHRQRDVPRALRYYKHLLETSENSELKRKLGSYYEEGYEVDRDEAKAWEYYLQIYEFHKWCSPENLDYPSATQKWANLEGDSLESALKSKAIRLVDAAWLIRFYQVNGQTMIPRRQDMPEDAFLTADEVIRATRGGEIDVGRKLRLICLSYMWLDEDHPDPLGWTLGILVERLKEKVKSEIDGRQNCSWGVFWDYPSLFQRPRDENQQVLFRQGLEALAELYSHRYTFVFKVTSFPPSFPKGYPVEYASPEQQKHATTPYEERGWPYTESCWAGWTKSAEKCVDISKDTPEFEKGKERSGMQFTAGIERTHVDLFCSMFLEKVVGISALAFDGESIEQKMNLIELSYGEMQSASRHTAVLPKDFIAKIESCNFTNKKKDCALVKDLYCDGFQNKFAQTDALDYQGMYWNDEHVCQAAKLIIEDVVPNVRKIYLGKNLFGAGGAHALAKAVSKIPPNRFLHLNLMYNLNLRDAGVVALSAGITNLHSLCLAGTFMGATACHALRDVIMSETSALCILDVSDNPLIGDEGCMALSGAAPALEVLEMADCEIGDKGLHSFVDTLLTHAALDECHLKQLNLRGNTFGNESAASLLKLQDSNGCPFRFDKLDVSNTNISRELKSKLDVNDEHPFFRRRHSDS